MRLARWIGIAAIGIAATSLPGVGCGADDDGPGPGTWDEILIEQSGTARVDLVVLVDNSGSMSQEQAALTARFPELIEELVDPRGEDHDPVEDLRIAVVSSDMGTMGLTVPTCRDSADGDDGCFMHEPSPPAGGCAATYPRFLSRGPGDDSYTAFAMGNDFACIATLGTAGCGFEQQFKAMHKAVADNALPGRCNEGFLRPDSLLGLIFVTDEEDCSVDPAHPEMFDTALADTLGHLNVRCARHPENVETVETYVARFRALRPDRPHSIVMGMIVGVPPDAPQCNGSGDQLAGCLALEAMIPRFNAAGDGVEPSCDTPMGKAYPPVRFVQLAQSWGNGAYVGSICREDWSGPLRAITDKLVGRLPSACFARALPADARNPCMAGCILIERLSDTRGCEVDPTCPESWCATASSDQAFALAPCENPVTGDTCEPLKRDLGLVAVAGGSQVRECLVRQAPRLDADPSAGVLCSTAMQTGWYYRATGTDGPGDPPCPQLVLSRGTEASLLEPGSTGLFRCPR
jgi:hypothetical protein